MEVGSLIGALNGPAWLGTDGFNMSSAAVLWVSAGLVN